MSECAHYLSDIYGVKFENIRNKLKKRRGSIFDYDVRYLPNAQTGRAGSTEQGTVE